MLLCNDSYHEIKSCNKISNNEYAVIEWSCFHYYVDYILYKIIVYISS